MSLINKALWHINSHTDGELSLDSIARAVGVSRHHLAHAFGEATGRSVMGYVRGLRLSEAAGKLAEGAPDILSVALGAGYGSHEAFTRAFRDQFGLTPGEVREQRSFPRLNLVEPLRMSQSASLITLATPRMVNGKSMKLAGLKASYTFETMAGLPAQWQKFAPHLGHVPGQLPHVGYGAVFNVSDRGFDYLCGVEVSDFDRLPADFDRLSVPAQTYAVFAQADHISKIRGLWNAILNEWLPKSGRAAADGPKLERYPEAFDGETGEGGFEIWIPLKP